MMYTNSARLSFTCLVTIMVSLPTVVAGHDLPASIPSHYRMHFSIPDRATSVSTAALGIDLQPPYRDARVALAMVQSHVILYRLMDHTVVPVRLGLGPTCGVEPSECHISILPLDALTPGEEYFLAFVGIPTDLELLGFAETYLSGGGEFGVRFMVSGPPRIRYVRVRRADGGRFIMDVYLSERVWSSDEPVVSIDGLASSQANCYSTISSKHWTLRGSSRLEFVCDSKPVTGDLGSISMKFPELPAILYELSDVKTLTEDLYVVMPK